MAVRGTAKYQEKKISLSRSGKKRQFANQKILHLTKPHHEDELYLNVKDDADGREDFNVSEKSDPDWNGSENEMDDEVDDGKDTGSSACSAERGLVTGHDSIKSSKSSRMESDDERNYRAASSFDSESENESDDDARISGSNEMEMKACAAEDLFESNDDLDDGDIDINKPQIKQYHVYRIKQDKLNMSVQGYRAEAARDCGLENNGQKNNNSGSEKDYTPFDPSEVEYSGFTFKKNCCYVMKEQNDITVGILHFLPNDVAECILVERFENTFLGIEDDGIPYKADFKIGTHVQVFQCIETMPLSKLGNNAVGINEIPRLIYQSQTIGNWYTFGYFYDRNEMQLSGKRHNDIRSLEVFAGAGGSLLGYKKYGFKTVMAIENDMDAVQTLKTNNPELKVYDECIRKFLESFHVLKFALGRIDHVHFSSPCQEFSAANRFPPTGDIRERADLSLLFIDVLRETSCSTAVFENVVGIWRRNNMHYLKKIAKEVMKLGYQVRCTVLHARDYGDPQSRPRFFMFASKNSVPLPSIPPKTHGSSDEPHLWPFKTVKNALSQVKDSNSWPNMEGKKTNLRPGQHGLVRLMPYDTAPTIRATSVPPFHYAQDRCITVREAACLQSFPLDWEFCGNLTSQYKQVGNAVPVEMASAIAHSIKQVLDFEYKVDTQD